jgi:SAM-dependent methyltransferase
MSSDSRFRCPTCDAQVSNLLPFCPQCISPINIPEFSSFSPNDNAHALVGLLDSIRDLISSNCLLSNLSPASADLLKAYLSTFWLRPGNALLQTLEALHFAAKTQRTEAGPFLDLGCGDGINSSLLRGWRFGFDFDAYSGLNLEQKDIFNSPADLSRPVQIDRLARPIDFGVDLRKNSLERACSLGTFRHTLQAEAAKIPLNDSSISLIYSNVLRDFNDIHLSLALKECRRLLSRSGELVFSAQTPLFRQSLYFFNKASAEYDLVSTQQYMKLDRGRSRYSAQQNSVERWAQILESNGFVLTAHAPFGSAASIKLWDTDLRPFTHIFINWLQKLKPLERKLVKERSVELWAEILMPALYADANAQQHAFELFTARPKH